MFLKFHRDLVAFWRGIRYVPKPGMLSLIIDFIVYCSTPHQTADVFVVFIQRSRNLVNILTAESWCRGRRSSGEKWGKQGMVLGN